MPGRTPRSAESPPEISAQAEQTPGATLAREQAGRLTGGPDAGIMTEEASRPTITLLTGAVVDAREAAGTWKRLSSLLTVNPARFRTLLALVQNRPADADPGHFECLWADGFLHKDRRTLNPVTLGVFLNSYEETKEGPLICPLRLQNENDRLVAERALAEAGQALWDFLNSKKGKGWSRD